MTTLAIQTALLLLSSGPRGRASACLVDLNFQHGACADYLDLEPRLDLNEIEPRPDRLDKQLLDVMISYHASGLAVIAAPNRPAEMRSFDPDVVTKLLDLVSTHFDYVVIDMPRTWFSWTDSVLFGSNRLFIVSEMTVPGLKHARQLVGAIRERLNEGPVAAGDRQPLRAAPVLGRPEETRHRAGARQGFRRRRFRISIAWCAKRSIAACRSRRSSAATRSRSELKKLIAPPPAKEAARKAPPEQKKLNLSLAR